MGGLRRRLVGGVLLGGLAGLTWTSLLDERARNSVRRAALVTSNLANHLVATYMDSEANSRESAAAERNREWVEQQWRDARY